jgi:hypothetical protein
VLGIVSGEMIFTDPAVNRFIHLPETALHVVKGLFAASVIGFTTLFIKWLRRAS